VGRNGRRGMKYVTHLQPVASEGVKMYYESIAGRPDFGNLFDYETKAFIGAFTGIRRVITKGKLFENNIDAVNRTGSIFSMYVAPNTPYNGVMLTGTVIVVL